MSGGPFAKTTPPLASLSSQTRAAAGAIPPPSGKGENKGQKGKNRVEVERESKERLKVVSKQATDDGTGDGSNERRASREPWKGRK